MARTNDLVNFLNDVALAIKTKLNNNTPIPASQFDTAIMSIETPGTYQNKQVPAITANGNYTITPDSGYDALSSVSISIQVPVNVLQSKAYTFTQNTTITLRPDQGYDGFSSIELTINTTTVHNQNILITENGTYTAEQGYTGLGEVTVNIPGSGEVKLFPTEQAMRADTESEEGDLAIVYNSELTNVTSASEFDTFILPITVVMPTAITSSSQAEFRDDEYMTNVYVEVSNSNVNITIYTPSTSQSYSYSSNDGITYTLDNSESDITVELDNKVKYEYGELNNVAHFIKCYNYTFTGLYKYDTVTHTTEYYPAYLGSTIDNGDTYVTPNTPDTYIMCSSYIPDGSMIIVHSVEDSIVNGVTLKVAKDFDVYTDSAWLIPEVKKVVYEKWNINPYTYEIQEYIDGELSNTRTVTCDGDGDYTVPSGSNTDQVYVLGDYSSTDYVILYYPSYDYEEYIDRYVFNIDAGTVLAKNNTMYIRAKPYEYDTLEYVYAPTQFTLDHPYDLLSGKIAYSNDGIITGTMPNNGRLNITPAITSQQIPSGYTSGGTVKAITSDLIPNLTSNNIVFGKQILDITGSAPDGNDFILNADTIFKNTKSTTDVSVYSQTTANINNLIVNSYGEVVGGIIAYNSNIQTFGWDGTKIVNVTSYTTSQLGVGSVGSCGVAASLYDDDGGIVAFRCSSTTYFLRYTVEYTMENNVLQPKIVIHTNTGKWKYTNSTYQSSSCWYVSFNPWNKYSCVVAGQNRVEIFLALPTPTDLSSWTDCVVNTSFSRTSGYQLGNKGMFAKEGKVYYTRNTNSNSYSDVYVLDDNYMPIKKNSLQVVIIRPDGEKGINNSGYAVLLSYNMSNGTVTASTSSRISNYPTSQYYHYIGSITGKTCVLSSGQTGPITFYSINWDNYTCSVAGTYTPVKNQDGGYYQYNHVRDCGCNAFLAPNDSDYKTYKPRIFEFVRDLDHIKSITYKNVTYPNTSDATATSSDIASGKTAYINGGKTTGNVPTVTSYSTYSTFTYSRLDDTNKMQVSAINTNNKLFRSNSYIRYQIPYSDWCTKGPIKKFNSVTDMNNYANSVKNDLAVIYTNVPSTITSEDALMNILLEQTITASSSEFAGITNYNTIEFTFESPDGEGETLYLACRLDLYVEENYGWDPENPDDVGPYHISAEIYCVDDCASKYMDAYYATTYNIDTDTYTFTKNNDVDTFDYTYGVEYAGDNWSNYASIFNKFIHKNTRTYNGTYLFNGSSWTELSSDTEYAENLELSEEILGEEENE